MRFGTKMGTKFMTAIGIFVLLFGGFVLYKTWSYTNSKARTLMEAEAKLALQFDLAIRDYVAHVVRPFAEEHLGRDDFVPEVMSTSFVARTIFQDVRKQIPGIVIKFSSDNPRNPINQAGPEELKLIKYFNENPGIEEWTGEIKLNGKKYLAYFRARRTKEECLRCHGDPRDAPQSLLERYGNKGGFHRTVGKVMALDTIAIPCFGYQATAFREMRFEFFVLSVGICLLLAGIYWIFNFMVTRRLETLTHHFTKTLAKGPDTSVSPVDISGCDEIGDLEKSFNLMARTLRAMYDSLENQVIQRTKELEESKERFALAMSVANDGIWDWHLKENIAFFDARYYTMAGYAPNEFPSCFEEWEKRVHPDDIGETRLRFERYLTGESEAYEAEFRFLCKDGDYMWIRARGKIVARDGKGKPTRFVGTHSDITERKKAEYDKIRLETKLRQAQKVEAIGTLAGGIAHDFNNILGAIIGLSELALMEVPEGSTLHRHIEQVHKSGMRAKDLVKQILTFSRQRERERMRMSITPIVKEALKLLRSSLPSTINIETQVESNPGLIDGDPTQIHQIIMNLCANAEHAMREHGGLLTVKVRKVKCNAEMEILKAHPNLHPGDYVLLSVSDTGCGIAREAMGQIFDPYFTTKKMGEGTGLGLAVVQGIVRKHGGAVTVESEVGKGTTFEVYFPAVKGEEEVVVGEEKTGTSLPTGNERVLFVDDEEMLAEVGKEILEHLGYDVTTRTSSLEALELFKAKPGYFDLVITDMSMPNMTGAELSRELMKIRPDIPIILCTGFSHIISKEKARDIGIQAFAMKPLVTKDLAETIRKVLGG